MSMAKWEREILRELREVTGERSLRLKDLMEWSTGKLTPQDGEKMVYLPHNGVDVCYNTREKVTPE